MRVSFLSYAPPRSLFESSKALSNPLFSPSHLSKKLSSGGSSSSISRRRRRSFGALSASAMAEGSPLTVLVTGAGGRTGNSLSFLHNVSIRITIHRVVVLLGLAWNY